MIFTVKRDLLACCHPDGAVQIVVDAHDARLAEGVVAVVAGHRAALVAAGDAGARHGVVSWTGNKSDFLKHFKI